MPFDGARAPTAEFFVCQPKPRSFDDPGAWPRGGRPKPANWRERAPGGYNRSSAFPFSKGGSVDMRGKLTSPAMTTGDKWEPPIFLPRPEPVKVARVRKSAPVHEEDKPVVEIVEFPAAPTTEAVDRYRVAVEVLREMAAGYGPRRAHKLAAMADFVEQHAKRAEGGEK